MEDLFTRNESGQESVRCEARIAKLDQDSSVIIFAIFRSPAAFRDGEELVKEVTIRKKDEEANRFTRRGKEWNLGCNGSPRSFARIDGSVKR
jgi:hypothetical protein